MKRLLIPILLMCILLSGCVSGENDTGTYDGDLEGLLIEQADLPDRYMRDDDSAIVIPDFLGTLEEYGHIESVSRFYTIQIAEGDYVCGTMIGQSVTRFDKNKTLDFLDSACSQLEEMCSDPLNESLDGFSSTIEQYEHKPIGDASYVTIYNITSDEETDDPFANMVLYNVMFVKKDIYVNISGGNYDERLGVEELIELARAVAGMI